MIVGIPSPLFSTPVRKAADNSRPTRGGKCVRGKREAGGDFEDGW